MILTGHRPTAAVTMAGAATRLELFSVQTRKIIFVQPSEKLIPILKYHLKNICKEINQKQFDGIIGLQGDFLIKKVYLN